MASRDPGKPWRDGSKRLAGIELEYNQVQDSAPIADFLDAWRAGHHSDGSCGWEVVTAPIAGKHVDACLKALGRAFDQAETEANESCGIHVHVDAGDMRWADMYRLLHVYAKVEPLLYLLGGQKRMQNTYCMPVGKLYTQAMANVDRKGQCLAVAYASPEGRMAARRNPGKKAGGRYRGLNICPWLAGRRRQQIRPDTTVEFRIHRNSLDMSRVTGWVKLLVTLVDWCAKATDKEAAALPRSALRALCALAPESKEWILARVKAWRRATRPKARLIKVKGGLYTCAD